MQEIHQELINPVQVWDFKGSRPIPTCCNSYLIEQGKKMPEISRFHHLKDPEKIETVAFLQWPPQDCNTEAAFNRFKDIPVQKVSPKSLEFLTCHRGSVQTCVWGNKPAIWLSNQSRLTSKAFQKLCNFSIYFHSKSNGNIAFQDSDQNRSNLAFIPGFKRKFSLKYLN